MSNTLIRYDDYDDHSYACREDKRGPPELKVCLDCHPGKVFYPYMYTTHMNLFDAAPPVFGPQRTIDRSSRANEVGS